MTYSIDKINKKINAAITLLFKNDAFLLKSNVSERSISFKLAGYLQEQFPDWNIDCEYNKKGDAKKELEGIAGCSEKKTTNLVLPDIIIHHRDTTDNLLVLEIKTNNQKLICDIKKLELFTSNTSEYKYNFGLFIKFNRENEPILRWFKDGEEFNVAIEN